MKRNKFSLSHYKLLTMDMGKLVPVSWYEVLPGDTIQQRSSALIRVSPLLSPVMHPVRVRLHSFYVPNRLMWANWEDFITGGEDGLDATAHPYKSCATINEGDLKDYMGIPVGTYSPNWTVNALPFRAYVKIWNEYYRDQQLVTEETETDGDGNDTTTDTSTVQNVSWEKDYFTTARPDELLGSTVTIPLGTAAPVVGTGDLEPEFNIDGGVSTFKLSMQNTQAGAYWDAAADATGQGRWDDTKLEADLTSAAGIEINDLRLALALQRYQEARNRYGSRYVEYLKYLGVRSPDGRLQNPEYLGGGRSTIQFSEVLSTDSGGSDPVGDMKGHGISAMRSPRWRRFFPEHGIVMTLMSVVPKAIYTDAAERAWLRTTKEDYFQKELQFIGQQAITNREAHAFNSNPDNVFGYQDRYDEYRRKLSGIAGEFQSTLNYWHYGRVYSGDIALNSSWVQATPTKRVNASSGTDCLYVMTNHSVQARRMLAKTGRSKTF